MNITEVKTQAVEGNPPNSVHQTFHMW